ncbi:MAG: Na+/H+ antiporter subunit E [Ilumatobacteraceae bacterium]|nr:Na+/H+ antiporter subunit E [Ilumatobacteraceae bacterium]
MKAVTRVPALVVWLVVLWVGLWGSITWANVLGGLAVAVGVLVVARYYDPDDDRPVRVRPHWAVVYAAVFLVLLVRSNLELARQVLTPRPAFRSAIVAVPLCVESPGLVTLIANSVTLTPGTLSIEVLDGPDGLPVLYVHALDARDPDAVRGDVRFLERYAARAFGTADERARAEVAA